MKNFKNIVFWFLEHPVLSGVGSLVTIASALISFLIFCNDSPLSSGEPVSNNPGCIKEPIQITLQNETLNLTKSSSYLSGCYIDGCYTYQLKITDLVETDISNQYLKGLDWHVGLSVSEVKADGRTHATIIKIRSNGRSLDEIRSKSTHSLDEKVHVWMDYLNICNKEKM
ncbi:MAG: hypothetical protein ACL93V_15845 [Candidatus Electrothrix sp. YB6]